MIRNPNYPNQCMGMGDVGRRGFLKSAFACSIADIADFSGGRSQLGTVSQEAPERVQTVQGPIGAEQLGTALMHEHLFVLDPEMAINYPGEWGSEEKRIEQAVAKLNELKKRGVDTIVDLTVIGTGRNIPRIQRIARGTQLKIVVATGVYTYGDLPFALRSRVRNAALGGLDYLVKLFVRDITEGIAQTGVKAGILKCATDAAGVTPDIESILRATARAQRRTGVPITTHTNAARKVGLDQQKIFREEGVDLSRVVIGHSGDTTDLKYLEELIGNGSYIGMDRFGINTILPFEDRVNTVAELCKRGHAGRMVLSHDACIFIDWFPEKMLAATAPQWHFLHIHNDVLPALKSKGVTGEQIRTMLVDNPRSILQPTAAY
jgi:phosphotriesterase-related protein